MRCIDDPPSSSDKSTGERLAPGSIAAAVANCDAASCRDSACRPGRGAHSPTPSAPQALRTCRKHPRRNEPSSPLVEARHHGIANVLTSALTMRGIAAPDVRSAFRPVRRTRELARMASAPMRACSSRFAAEFGSMHSTTRGRPSSQDFESELASSARVSHRSCATPTLAQS